MRDTNTEDRIVQPMMDRTAPMGIEQAVWYVAEKLLADVDVEHFTKLLDAIEPYPDLVINEDGHDQEKEREGADAEALQRLRARLRPLVVEQIRTFANEGETLGLLRSAYNRYRTWPRGSEG